MCNVQSKARAALVTPGGEKRVKYLTPHLRAHAAAVVRKQHLDIVVALSQLSQLACQNDNFREF